MLSLSKILAPVDFSERSASAVRCAIDLAGCFQSQLTLLHVLPALVPPPHEYPEMYVGAAPVEIVAERRARSSRDLENFLNGEVTYPHLTRLLLEGDAARQIAETAAAGSFDLILMPTHGRGSFRRLLVGSVTAKVLHDAACPVWTSVHIHTTPDDGRLAVGRVLCALDLGPSSTATLDWAAGFSERLNSTLAIVHVAPLDPRTEAYYLSPEWRGRTIEAAKSRIEELQAEAGTHCEVHVESGDIRQAICDTARDSHADLLVTGRGGAAGATGRLASHAYSIIRDSPCPVVTV